MNKLDDLVNDLKEFKEDLLELVEQQYSSDSWNELTSAEKRTFLFIDMLVREYENAEVKRSKLN